MNSTLKLSSNGLFDAVIACHNNDFDFIVNSQTFSCPKFLADFISPRISRIHMNDSSCSQFSINIPEAEIVFPKIIKLMEGSSIIVESSEIPIFRQIAHALDNKEFIAELPTNSSNEIDKAINSAIFKGMNGQDLGETASFIASNIEDIVPDELAHLDIYLLSQIFSSESLSVQSEDSLFDIIECLIAIGGDKFKQLFQYVHFENVSVEIISKFLEIMSEDGLTGSLFDAIKPRLLFDINKYKNTKTKNNSNDSNDSNNSNNKNNQNNKNNKNSINNNNVKDGENLENLDYKEFKFNSLQPLNGITKYLSKIAGGNAHLKGLIKISGSSSWGTSEPNMLYQIIDNDLIFWRGTRNDPNAWIQFDFKERKIELSAYTIETFNWDPNGHHMKSWEILGSNNETDWEVLDVKIGNDELNGNGRRASWKIQESRPFRYIRIHSRGETHGGRSTFLYLSHCEFFGKLIN